MFNPIEQIYHLSISNAKIQPFLQLGAGLVQENTKGVQNSDIGT